MGTVWIDNDPRYTHSPFLSHIASIFRAYLAHTARTGSKLQNAARIAKAVAPEYLRGPGAAGGAEARAAAETEIAGQP